METYVIIPVGLGCEHPRLIPFRPLYRPGCFCKTLLFKKLCGLSLCCGRMADSNLILLLITGKCRQILNLAFNSIRYPPRKLTTGDIIQSFAAILVF